MKFRSCWLIFFLIGLSLTSCSQPKSSQEIAETVNKSLVLIYYENQGGHGTGFIVPGKKGVCTVLTAGHVVKGYSLKLQTYQDKQSHTTDSIQTSPTYDLAVVTFKSAGENCPYQSVNLGDSNELKVGHKIYISGFPVLQNEDLAPEFLEGSVSRINVVLTEGYGINYTAQVSVGISGAPVLDASGKVVAVHGQAKDKLPRGIPIKTYLANRTNLNLNPTQSPGTESFGNPIRQSPGSKPNPLLGNPIRQSPGSKPSPGVASPRALNSRLKQWYKSWLSRTPSDEAVLVWCGVYFMGGTGLLVGVVVIAEGVLGERWSFVGLLGGLGVFVLVFLWVWSLV